MRKRSSNRPATHQRAGPQSVCSSFDESLHFPTGPTLLPAVFCYSQRGLTRIFRGLLWVSGCRYAKVPVLQGIIGLLYGSISLTGRHFAGEEYRGRVAGESVG